MTDNLTGYKSPQQRIRDLEQIFYDMSVNVMRLECRVYDLQRSMRRLRKRIKRGDHVKTKR